MEPVRKIIRLYGTRNTAIMGAIALLLSITMCWEMNRYLKHHAMSLKEPRFLILQRDVPKDRPVEFADLGFVLSNQLDKRDLGRSGELMTDQELSELRNARARSALSKGQLLKKHDLVSVVGLSVQIPKGRRAYGLSFSEAVLARPGDWVDIYYTGEFSDFPTVLLERARVLKLTGEKDAVLALSGAEIQEMEKAQQRGKLTMALRNPDEPPPNGERSTRFPSRRLRKKMKHLEIYSESE